jgi:hypothetical protein
MVNQEAPYGYNPRTGEPYKRSPECRSKQSARMKGTPSPMEGKTHSPETKAKMSAVGKGKKFTEGQRAKMSASSKGKKKSVDHRAKISAAKKGQPSPMEGKTHSTETLAKMAINCNIARSTLKHGKDDPSHISHHAASNCVLLDLGNRLYKVGKADCVDSRYPEYKRKDVLLRISGTRYQAYNLEQSTLAHLRNLGFSVGVTADDTPVGGHTECFWSHDGKAVEAAFNYLMSEVE